MAIFGGTMGMVKGGSLDGGEEQSGDGEEKSAQKNEVFQKNSW
jgi:hypothetical protein